MLDILIFWDLMVGPSSHTAGAVRIGRMAGCCWAMRRWRPGSACLGPFAETGQGHGTDRALVGAAGHEAR